MTTKTLRLTLTSEDMKRLASLLSEFAQELSDDGRDDSPDAELIWTLQKQVSAEAGR